MIDSITRPSALPVKIENIPRELKASARWVWWRYEYRPQDTKPFTKVPYDPKRPEGIRASSTDPTSWDTFAATWEKFKPDTFDGIGFVLGAPYVGVDLDDVFYQENGTRKLTERAKEVITRFASYTEVSPSGKGVRIFVRGKLLGKGRKRDGIEIYDGGRYLTVTGWKLPTLPDCIEDRQSEVEALYAELAPPVETTSRATDATDASGSYLSDSEVIEHARNARNGELFNRLWAGVTKGYQSHSEADQALCNLLAFWCGRDPEQMDRVFRRSGLMRDKWERDDYRENTIQRAVDGCEEVYRAPHHIDTEDLAEVLRYEHPTQQQGTAMNYLIDLNTHRSVKRAYDWIIPDCLYQGGLFLLAGNPGAGKSVLLQQLTTDVMYGADVFGKQVSPRPVLWLDWDGGALHYEHQRDIALKGRDPNAINHLYRYATTTPELQGQKRLPDYVTPDFLDLMTTAYPNKRGVIVIDCLRSAFCAMPTLGENWENNNGLMYKLVGSLRDWSHNTKWTVILIHHYNKSGGVSGAFGIEGASDVVWDFDREKGQTHAQLVIRRRIPREQKLHLDYEEDLYTFQGANKDVQEREVVRNKLELAEGIYNQLKDATPATPLTGRDIEQELRKTGIGFKNTIFRTVMNELDQYEIIHSLGIQKGNTLKDGHEKAMEAYRKRMQ